MESVQDFVLYRGTHRKTYLALKEKDKAKEELEYVINMESDNRWFYAIDENKEVARELLNSKKFKKK